MSDYPPDAPALSQAECCRLIASLAAGMADRGGFTEQQARALLDWAARVRLDAALVDLVIRGELVVSWRKGQPEFAAPESLADGGESLRYAMARISDAEES